MLLREPKPTSNELNNMVINTYGHSTDDVVHAINGSVHTQERIGSVFISNGTWNLCDLLEELIRVCGVVENLFITSYSFTETSARRLGLLCFDKKIKNCVIVLDHKATVRYPNVTQLLVGFAEVKFTEIHAKILDIGFEDNFLNATLIGSANWTNNKRIETLAIVRSTSISLFKDSLKRCN